MSESHDNGRLLDAIRRIKAELTVLEAGLTGQSPLQAFIDARFVLSPDPEVPLADFFKEFLSTLPRDEQKAWTKSRLQSELPKPLTCSGSMIRGLKRKPTV